MSLNKQQDVMVSPGCFQGQPSADLESGRPVIILVLFVLTVDVVPVFVLSVDRESVSLLCVF